MTPAERPVHGEITARGTNEHTRLSRRQPARRVGEIDTAWERERVESSQRGDAEAFVDLYVAYEPRIGAYCTSILHNASDAEDAVQETFVRAWQRLPDLVGKRHFFAWLRVIAHNVCIDTVRKRARSHPVDDVALEALGSPSPSSEETVLRHLSTAVVAEAVTRLSPRHREVLHLREGLEWSYQQIAAHDGVPVSTTETLLFRARRALRKEIVALGGGEGNLGILLVPARRALGRVMARWHRIVAPSRSRDQVLHATQILMASGAAVAVAAMATLASPSAAATSAPTTASAGLAASPSVDGGSSQNTGTPPSGPRSPDDGSAGKGARSPEVLPPLMLLASPGRAATPIGELSAILSPFVPGRNGHTHLGPIGTGEVVDAAGALTSLNTLGVGVVLPGGGGVSGPPKSATAAVGSAVISLGQSADQSLQSVGAATAQTTRKLGGAVTSTGTAASTGIRRGGDRVAKTVVQTTGAAAQTLSSLGDSVVAAGPPTPSGPVSVPADASSATGAATSAVGSTANAASSTVANTGSALGQTVSTVSNAAGNVVAGTTAAAGSAVTNAGATVSSVTSSAGNTVAGTTQLVGGLLGGS